LDEEISRQEEARRILDSIRHKETSENEEKAPVKPISHIPEEEQNQLKALVAQKLKLKPEELASPEELPDPENIDPISNEQIKVMRQVAVIKSEEKKPLKAAMIDAIIKGYFEIADSFKIKSDARRSCFKQGHECMHCGKKIAFEAVEHYAKAKKNKDHADEEAAAEVPSESK
jgi:hypothetical protein